MVHRSSPFRLLVTALLVVAVPFCCCNFRSLLSECASCQAPVKRGEAEVVMQDHDDGAAHHHASHHEHGTQSSTDGGHGTKPCAPGNEKHDCNCGKNDGKMLTVQKSTVELQAPVVIAVLDWALSADLTPNALFRGQDREQRVVQRPQTSLLRMHCALIV